MAGITEEEFNQIAEEIRGAWGQATTRDAAFDVIVNYGRKHGYKNVIAAIQSRRPKQFTREKSVDRWLEEQHTEEGSSDT